MFGDNLKVLRKNKNLSMEDLVSQYNKRFNGRLNKSTISRYENNLQEPMINVAKSLASFFDVPVDFLTGDSDMIDNLGNKKTMTEREKKIILAYRTKHNLQHAVEVLLGVEDDSNNNDCP